MLPKLLSNLSMVLKRIISLFALILLLQSCVESDFQEFSEEDKADEIAMFQLQQARQDSLNTYLKKAEEQLNNKKIEFGIQYLDSALIYATVDRKNEIHVQKAQLYVNQKKYDAAIAEYNELINVKHDIKESYYKRALCYQKQRKTQEAVNDLKQAITFGHAEARELHEKINPIKKRVSYYVTRCCDGTTSHAKGRGACSHHGGVCNWNDPVYEGYRKY